VGAVERVRRPGARWLAAALAVAVAAVASACGERSEPTGATVHLFPVTVHDAAGRAVELTTNPARIAALTPGTTELLAALGAGDRVVGIPAGARRNAAPRAHLVIDKRGRFEPEQLRRGRPQLIVASSEVPLASARHVAARLHAPVYVAPATSLRDVETAVTALGLLVDEPIAARRVVSKLETARQRVTARVAGTRLVRTFVDTGFFTTVPNRSLVGDLIRIAHGRNVAGPSPDPGPLEAGELRRLQPSVYIATSQSGTSLSSLRKDPVLKRLAAVRHRRFVTIDSMLLEPGPFAGAGLTAIARALHPSAFR
jgi:ABC-type Fe3+-hydroxamate transport system substrate-binding protein